MGRECRNMVKRVQEREGVCIEIRWEVNPCLPACKPGSAFSSSLVPTQKGPLEAQVHWD